MSTRRATRLILAGLALHLAACLGCRSAAGHLDRNQSLYVTMRDRVRIAIDVWLPADLKPGKRIPAVIRATRYWRARGHTSGCLEDDDNFEEAEGFNNEGYALVLVDARGSGASFGYRPYELLESEVRDYGEVAEWIVSQPWSNGRVGAHGVSYAGNTAEMLAVNRHPAVKAVAPLFNDFDNFGHLVFPGGLLTVGFLADWSRSVHMMDMNDICGLAGVTGDECDQLRAKTTGVKPVDVDTDGAILAAAVRDHQRNTIPFEAALQYEFRDDPFGPYGERNVGYRRSPAGFLPAIEASGVAILVRVGWQDAGTVNGAIGRYTTIDNPQRVLIGPWDHGAHNDADPFHAPDAQLAPNREDQFAELIDFFDTFLKDGATEELESRIEYYTLGADRWTTTANWPPDGFAERSWYFAAGGRLVDRQVSTETGSDRYTIDFTATTGVQNRWYTNGGAGDVIYPDRREQDLRLLTYTSDPLDQDMEITGHPLVTLFVQSTHEDGAFIVYLEDVAPDGRVTYITEGQLRAVMRKTTDKPALYNKFGPHRSELREDAMPLVPGEVAELTFDLWATSVLIRRGHRIRVAVAGADKDTFLRYPRNGNVPTITVERNARFASGIALPTKVITGSR